MYSVAGCRSLPEIREELSPRKGIKRNATRKESTEIETLSRDVTTIRKRPADPSMQEDVSLSLDARSRTRDVRPDRTCTKAPMTTARSSVYGLCISLLFWLFPFSILQKETARFPVVVAPCVGAGG